MTGSAWTTVPCSVLACVACLIVVWQPGHVALPMAAAEAAAALDFASRLCI